MEKVVSLNHLVVVPSPFPRWNQRDQHPFVGQGSITTIKTGLTIPSVSLPKESSLFLPFGTGRTGCVLQILEPVLYWDREWSAQARVWLEEELAH